MDLSLFKKGQTEAKPIKKIIKETALQLAFVKCL